MDHFLITETSDEAVITLNRPEKGNSYNGDVAEALATTLERLTNFPLKKLVLKANGKHFCTGADLDWMAEGPKLSREDNIREMDKIFRMYKAFLSLPFPVESHVHGKIRGGGLGIVCVSDIVIADTETDFHLPERKLGLVPGIIEPIVLARVGAQGLAALEDHIVHVSEGKDFGLIHSTGMKIGATPEILKKMEEKKIESAERRNHFLHVR